MIKYLVFLLFAFQSFAQHSDPAQLSGVARGLREAYRALSTNPNSKDHQRVYINSFPNDYATLAALLDPPDSGQLYDSSDRYIEILGSIASNYPESVGKKLISLAKDGELYLRQSSFIADAPAFLQHQTISFAITHSNAFINVVNQLRRSERDSLITFLADVESHDAYEEYKQFVDILKSRKQSQLYQLFVRAKEKRMKFKHHAE